MTSISTLLNNFQAFGNSFLEWFSTAVKQTIAAYCDLETADALHTFAAHDGGLVSIIRLDGTTQLVGAVELEEIQHQLTQNLTSLMASPGHTLQVVFHYNPMQVEAHLKKLLLSSQLNQAVFTSELTELMEERLRYLAQHCADEVVYMVIWTHPRHLNGAESQQAEKDKLSIIHTKQLPHSKLSQNVVAAIPLLRNTHEIAVKSVLQQLGALHMQATLLEVHAAAFEIRKLADPEFTDDNWRASLPGDAITLKNYPRYQENVSDILWPSLAQQLLPRDAENLDLRTVRFGDRIYTSLFVNLLAKDIQTFNHLLKQTVNANVPWRIAFLVDSDSLQQLKFKSLLATVLSFSSDENRLLSDANDLLHYINVNSDEAIVQVKMVVCTWANIDQTDLLRRRASALARAMQNWGMHDISEIAGDPFEGFVSTLPCISAKSIATPTLLPCSALVRLLPLARPASPWLVGTLLFRTPDGKPWPFQPGSNLQTTWIDLIYAGPGAGKSVLSNALNLASCLQPGALSLPYVSILDIGPSSKGFISLLKASLPKEKQYQVAHYTLEMGARYTINPFDTQLGARYPTPQERSFLINFLTLLATPIDANVSYNGIAEMTGLIVDELYKHYSDQYKPHKYRTAVEPMVDEQLKQLAIKEDSHSTWWEITDSLFKANAIEAARLAQRHAMPLLADVTQLARIATIQDLYGKMVTPTKETLIDAFTRMISSAIREYPILSGITRFDPIAANVVALDLEAVTKRGSAAADRQTAVMYMLARYVLTRNCYLTDALLGIVSNTYRSYHQARIDIISESTKRIVLDEFHRTSRTQMVRDQVINDMREGRKRNIQIALVSQSLDDFDPLMIELATSTYILEAGTTQTIEKAAKTFGLSATAQMLLRTQVRGPQVTGVNFLSQFVTTEGLKTQLLTLTLSPTELWALNTSVEDVLLRDKLSETVGSIAARALLAKHFPEGTARKIIEVRLNHSSEREKDSNELTTSIIDQLYRELLMQYSSLTVDTKPPQLSA